MICEVSIKMKLIDFLKRFWLLLVFELLVGYGFCAWWIQYMQLGYIEDSRHGIEFHGSQAYGHLIFITLAFVFITVLLIRRVIIWRN